MKQYKNPTWWTKDNDSAWERTKEAFKRDWDQTKHDFGGKQPDTDQNVKDTVKLSRRQCQHPSRRAACTHLRRSGNSVLRFRLTRLRRHYRDKYSKWNPEVENRLKEDWTSANPDANWDTDRDAVQRAWDYDEKSLNE